MLWEPKPYTRVCVRASSNTGASPRKGLIETFKMLYRHKGIILLVIVVVWYFRRLLGSHIYLVGLFYGRWAMYIIHIYIVYRWPVVVVTSRRRYIIIIRWVRELGERGNKMNNWKEVCGESRWISYNTLTYYTCIYMTQANLSTPAFFKTNEFIKI